MFDCHRVGRRAIARCPDTFSQEAISCAAVGVAVSIHNSTQQQLAKTFHFLDRLRRHLKRLLCIIFTLGLGDLMAGGGSSDTSSSVVQKKGSIAEL